MNESSASSPPTSTDVAPLSGDLIQPNLRGHLPVLDGIRGIAILLVLLYHQTNMNTAFPVDRVFARVMNFGWMGVDLFFVLSGFLITGILYDAKGTDLYFRNFYARRTLRIFPLYYGVILLYLVILPRFAPHFSETYGEVAGKGRWYWTYLSNFSLAFLPHPRGVLTSTWSLAIEEQFYLVWPTVVFFLSRRTLQKVCVGMIATAVVLRMVLFAFHANGMVIYALTPTRMDSLAAGAFIALAARGSGGAVSLIPMARRLAWVIGIFLAIWIPIRCLRHMERDLIMEVGGYSALGIFFASILLLAITCPPGRMLRRVLSQGWLRGLGRYSYAIYLLHTPLQEILASRVYPPTRYKAISDFLQDHVSRRLGSMLPGQFIFFIIANAATLLLAWLSWNLYEKHFLKLKRFFPMGRSKKALASDGAREGRPVRVTAGVVEPAPVAT